MDPQVAVQLQALFPAAIFVSPEGDCTEQLPWYTATRPCVPVFFMGPTCLGFQNMFLDCQVLEGKYPDLFIVVNLVDVLTARHLLCSWLKQQEIRTKQSALSNTNKRRSTISERKIRITFHRNRLKLFKTLHRLENRPLGTFSSLWKISLFCVCPYLRSGSWTWEADFF